MGSPRCPRPRRRVALLLAAVAPGGRGRLMDGRRPADAALWAGPPAPPAERGGAWAPAPEELEAYMAEASLMATSLAQDAVALSRQARGLQEALREAQQSAPRPHDPAGSLGGATPALPAEALQERGWAEAAEAAEARLAAAPAAGPPRERGWPEVEDAAAPAGQPARPVGGARRWEEEPLLAALDAGSAAAAAAGPWAFLPASPPPGDAEAEADALLANATEAPAETSTGKPPLERDPLSSADKAAICGEDAQFECSRVTEILTLGYRLSAFWSVVAWAVAGVLLGTCCCCGLSSCCARDRRRGR